MKNPEEVIMTRIIIGIALAAIALGSAASAFAANNAANCSAKGAAEFGTCIFEQSRGVQN